MLPCLFSFWWPLVILDFITPIFTSSTAPSVCVSDPLFLWGHQSLDLGTFPGGASVKEPACQCRRRKRHRFDPWVGKICWRRAWQSTPGFLPGESHGQRSMAGHSPWWHRVGHDSVSMRTVTLEMHREWIAQPYACMTLNLGWSHHNPYLNNFWLDPVSK